MNQAHAPLRMTVRRPGNLLSIELQRDLTEAELAAIRTVLRIHDHAEDAPCYCAFQFPDAPWSLRGLWQDAQRRADLLPSQAEVRHERLLLGEALSFDDEGTLRETPDFRKPGERVNGLYIVVPPSTDRDHEMMIGGDTAD